MCNRVVTLMTVRWTQLCGDHFFEVSFNSSIMYCVSIITLPPVVNSCLPQQGKLEFWTRECIALLFPWGGEAGFPGDGFRNNSPLLSMHYVRWIEI